jgi:hypothetical protein
MLITGNAPVAGTEHDRRKDGLEDINDQRALNDQQTKPEYKHISVKQRRSAIYH